MEAQPAPQTTPPLLSPKPHYTDSIDSSPRSRNTDFSDEPYPPPTANKLRFIVSYGGHISPRPYDKSLCYVGGDTRIVAVDRHTSLSELSTRFSKKFLNSLSFVLKYQLPDEDLDSLISVTTDEDFENMIEEFDHRTCNSSLSKPSRIRLFLFPAKPDSPGPVSVFDGPGLGLSSAKSEDWLTRSGFLDGGLSDFASVNCLPALDDGIAASSNESTNLVSSPEESVVQVDSGKNLKPGHDVQSDPDSPIQQKNSSCGSISSSVVNLGSIKVSVEDGGNTSGVVRGQDQQVEGIEENFAKLSVSSVGQKQDEENVVLASSVNVSPVNVSSAAVAAGECQNRVLSDDERSDNGVHVDHRKLPNSEQSQSQAQSLTPNSEQSQSQAEALTPQFQQKSTVVVDLPSPRSVSSGSITQFDPNNSVFDSHSLVQMRQHVLDPGYVLQHPFAQQQQQAWQHHFDQQKQQQASQHQFDQQQQQALQHQFDQQQQQQALQHQFDQQQQQQALQHQFDQQQQKTLQHQVDQQKQQQQVLQHQFDHQQQQASQQQFVQQQQQGSQQQFDQQQQALQQQFDQQQQQALQKQFDQQQRQQKPTLQHQFDQQQQQQQQALQHQFDQQQQQALQHQFDQQQQQVLEQEFDQQQQHHEQQTLQRQFDKQQQQEAPQPQQIIHGTHFIHQNPTGPMLIPAYYPVYPSQQQLHPQHHYQLDQQYPVYYLPARQAQAFNLSMQQQANLGESATIITSSLPQTPPNIASVVPPSAAYMPTGIAPLRSSEMTTADAYRKLAVGATQLVQVPSNQHHQQYAAYSQIPHLSHSTSPNSAAPAYYAYNYSNPTNAQIFYAQNLSPTKSSESRP